MERTLDPPLSVEAALQRTLETVPLLSSSADPWLACALADLDALLDDHAQCELKAAANALSMVARHPQHELLVRRMSSLAKEEMHHYRIVRRALVERGGTPSRLAANPYMKELGRGRLGGEFALLDDLILAAIVEARSCERFVVLSRALLADGAPAPAELGALYGRLARSESGHARLFLDLARQFFDPARVEPELARRVALEEQVLTVLPASPRMHGGMAPPLSGSKAASRA
jgi:tRNA-(ms[2]io[6]A)-hydroxylase